MAKLRKTIPIKQLEVPDSSLVAEDIINNFSIDPADTTKVAGADAVYTLFQLLESNDVDYDTLQEIVTFIKTIDTDGELVAAIDTAVGNTLWRTTYTDAEARAAQASLLTTGTSILFDRPRYYGYPTAVSGNITFDFTGAVNGQAQHIRVNASIKPTLPASIRLLAGNFIPDTINDYYLTPWLISSSPDVWVVHVTISQENDY